MDQQTTTSLCEIKAAPLEMKALGDNGEYEGHFAIFGNVDEGRDMSHPGMFLKTLAESGKRIKPLYLHDFDKLLGPTPDVLREDSVGLYAKGHVTLGTFWADQVWALLKDNAVNEGSFAYMPVKFDYDGDGIRHLREVKLYDISFVPLGMNGLTSVRAVKRALLHQLKAAIAPKKTPMADVDTEWDAAAVLKEVEGANQLRLIHAWVAPEGDPDAKSSYKLPHHLPDGKVVWKAVAAAGAALMGSRGGVDIPEADVEGVKKHLETHYAQFDKQVPWAKGVDVQGRIEALNALVTELKEGRMLSSANLETLRAAIDSMQEATRVLQELCAAADAPKSARATEYLKRRARAAALQLVSV